MHNAAALVESKPKRWRSASVLPSFHFNKGINVFRGVRFTHYGQRISFLKDLPLYKSAGNLTENMEGTTDAGNASKSGSLADLVDRDKLTIEVHNENHDKWETKMCKLKRNNKLPNQYETEKIKGKCTFVEFLNDTEDIQPWSILQHKGQRLVLWRLEANNIRKLVTEQVFLRERSLYKRVNFTTLQKVLPRDAENNNSGETTAYGAESMVHSDKREDGNSPLSEGYSGFTDENVYLENSEDEEKDSSTELGVEEIQEVSLTGNRTLRSSVTNQLEWRKATLTEGIADDSHTSEEFIQTLKKCQKALAKKTCDLATSKDENTKLNEELLKKIENAERNEVSHEGQINAMHAAQTKLANEKDEEIQASELRNTAATKEADHKISYLGQQLQEKEMEHSNALQEKLDEYNKLLVEKDLTFSNLLEQKDMISSELEQLLTRIEALKDTIQDNDNSLSIMKIQVIEKNRLLEERDRKILEQESSITQLRGIITSLENQIKNLQDVKNAYEKEIATSNDLITVLKKQLIEEEKKFKEYKDYYEPEEGELNESENYYDNSSYHNISQQNQGSSQLNINSATKYTLAQPTNNEVYGATALVNDTQAGTLLQIPALNSAPSMQPNNNYIPNAALIGNDTTTSNTSPIVSIATTPSTLPKPYYTNMTGNTNGPRAEQNNQVGNQSISIPIVTENGIVHHQVSFVNPFQNIDSPSTSNTKDTSFLTFRGGITGSMQIHDWISRMNGKLAENPSWNEEQQFMFLVKHLDKENPKLKGIINGGMVSWTHMQATLNILYASVDSRSFNVADWVKAKRYRGTTMKNWVSTPNGTRLCNQTAKRWNAKKLSQDEMTIIMDKIKLMVPASVLEIYITPEGEWDTPALLSMEFMVFFHKLTRHEETHISDWYYFNNKLDSPKDNNQDYFVNSVEMVKTPSQTTVVISADNKGNWIPQQPVGQHDSLLRPQDFQKYRGRGRSNKDNNRGSGRLPGRGRGQGVQPDQRYQVNYQQQPQQPQQQQQQNLQYQQGQQYQNQQPYQNRQVQQNPQVQPTIQRNGLTNQQNENRARGRDNNPSNGNRGRGRGNRNDRQQSRARGGRNNNSRVYTIEEFADNQQSAQNNQQENYQQQQATQYINYALPTPVQHSQPVPQYFNPQPQMIQTNPVQHYQAPAVPHQYANAKNGITPAPNTRNQGVGVVQQIYGHGH